MSAEPIKSFYGYLAGGIAALLIVAAVWPVFQGKKIENPFLLTTGLAILAPGVAIKKQ